MITSSLQPARGGSFPGRVARFISGLSSGIAFGERLTLIGLVVLITALILLNVATRYMGRPIFWIDELAVYLMVILCFVGTSLTIRRRLDFAVTFLIDRWGEVVRAKINPWLTLVSIAYAMFLIWCAWRMFDPVNLIAAGFDIANFTSKTRNFVYTEPTQTLEIPKFWILLVLPIFAVTSLIHSLTNFVEDLGLVERRSGLFAQADMG
jgi:TRAP-type C4-dicarboxylate transport system permease small subunit